MFKILDLFCGAGGFSYGIELNKNFKTVVALDFNKSAKDTFTNNFKNVKVICDDITSEHVKSKIISLSKSEGVNMVIGGPPCQGFSLKGKKAGLEDSRNFLFLEYFNIVKEIKPEVFIIENVKALINSCNGYFIDQIIKKFKEIGYFINYGVMDSSKFGVPQIRERTIIIGSLSKKLSLPKELGKKKITVREAISDLEFLNSAEGNFILDYKINPKSSYQKIMRKNSLNLYNHISTKHSELALKKLSFIPAEGDKSSLPMNLRGKQKFHTTWSRLIWDKPSPTIDTRFDTPSNGRNSHPILNRAITPREAARLQSFPDTFIFYGNKTEICKQIGNAVPPLMAKCIADSLISQYNFEKVESDFIKIYNEDAYVYIEKLKKDNIRPNHIITDPPYNISTDNNFDTLRKPRVGLKFGDWDTNFNLYGWIPKYIEILDKNGSIIIFCSYRFISYIIEVLEKNNAVVKDVIKWKKTNPMPRNIDRRYVQDTEFAVWAVKKSSKWVFNRKIDSKYLRAEFQSSVVSGKEKTLHPTQKSLKILEEIIEIHTNEGDLIIDPFMGSGTTGVAAKKLKRKFLGIEIENEYYKLAKDRIFKENKE
ncbi:DNA (cytosine-5-)-methyltransferase [Spiroplasma endosymbiont of Cantharis nigra]|uniref:DNA (cytosine-5-)-methyltransferase n=1 Tax=Spiroplasma endosymbiont of Cantharis nigra TaxID=3066278 RepID=UPI0030CBCE36